MTDDDFDRDLALLETLADDADRNALALRLATTDPRPELKAPLLRLIARDDLRDKRGTLVHALGYLDCAGELAVLTALVARGNFEVAHEAFAIVDHLDGARGDDVERAYAITRDALALAEPAVEDWRRALLTALLALYD